MWKQQKTSNFIQQLTLMFVITIIFWDTALGLSDKRLCADENCKTIISWGIGQVNYHAGEEGMVSFKLNSNIRVKSKSAGSDPSLWGVEVNGREGYAPKRLIKELKININEKDLKFTVDVVKPGEKIPKLSQEPVQNSSEILTETKKTELKPSPSQAPVLHTSEDGIETTTTQPLKAIKKDEVSSPVESHEQPQNASPVQHNIIEVEGSKLPTLNESSSENEIVKQQKGGESSPMAGLQYDDDDDGAIGDYDEEEGDGIEKTDEKNQKDIAGTTLEEEASNKSAPLILNVTTNETKLPETPNNNVENLGIETSTYNSKQQRDVEETEEKYQKDSAGATLEEDVAKIATPLSLNVTSNEIKLPEPRNNTVENLEIETSTDNSKQQRDGEEAEKYLENSAGTTLEEDATKTTTTLNSNANNNETKHIELPNNKVETIEMEISTENSTLQSFTQNGNSTGNISSAETLQQNTLQREVIQEATRATPLKNENTLTAANEGVRVLNESSEIRETTEKIPTVTQLNPDVTNNSLTENTNVFANGENSKESVESTSKADGAKQAFEKALIANEPGPSVPNETEELKPNEETSSNAINGETLTTANAKENAEEKHISKQSNLSDTKINTDVFTEAPAIVNNVDVIPNTAEISRFEENSNEPTESPSTHLPIETTTVITGEPGNEQVNKYNEATEGSPTHLPIETTDVVGETGNVQVNTNQYSPPATETNNIQTSTESVPSQQKPSQDSQLSNETPIKKQNEHPQSHASNNLPFDSQNPTNNQTQPPQPQSPQPDHPPENTNVYYTGSQYNPYDYDESSNTPLPPQYDSNNNNLNDLPQTTDIPLNDYYGQQPTEHTAAVDLEPEVTTENSVYASTSADSSPSNQPPFGLGSVEPAQRLDTPKEFPKQEEDPKSLPSMTPPVSVVELDRKENKGLFATIMDTVHNILPNNKNRKHVGYGTEERHNELDKILYSTKETTQAKGDDDTLFCEKLDPHNCPQSSLNTPLTGAECECSFKTLITTEFTLERFLQLLAAKVLEISELIAFLAIVAATSLFFIFGYYCFCNSSSEGALLSKLNQLESCLLASHKENAILKHNLMSTRQKLASIEDNSFGSNDMVVSLKKELEEELLEKARLQEQIVTLQKELENAADAGIELNKIVSELLSNQTGDESIISSVEELQKQLNEQQNTILEINASLAEKSRENSELQLMIAEQNARYDTQISDLQQDNDELEAEKGNLQSRLEEIRTDFDKDITAALESKNFEIKRLQNEIVDLCEKVENGHTKWQTSMAKVEALEECLRNVKRDPNVNITQVIDVANIRAELLDAQKKYNGLKERWEHELDARKLAENQLQYATAEVEKIKQDFNQTEKDKLEAQTRLEVLSNYFKDKENQLQKELSLKETMWLKQQGETTTTVDRLTTMQEEIQSLKSQNDALRAEIEAQVAAHKAQTGTLENRAHETWLAARQSDRRYEEARAEATALRRKLTVLAGGSVNEVNKPAAGAAGLGDDLANASSPIHMESPGSPMLGRMPPPPFLPPPFMGPPPPFMGMPPPPPFVPTGEMRPAPLGRIMSPPPPQRSGHMDYEDYLDYESNSSWHRHHTYSPPPRTYRSLSPTDSRYNYSAERDLISRYDTETDFSPPPSPRESRRRGGGGGYGSDKEDNTRHPYNNSKKSSSGSKAPISSGSDKSYNSSSMKGIKSKSGGGGKFLV